MSERAKRRAMSKNGELYVGVDVHEKESQLAVFEKGGLALCQDLLTYLRISRR
jgi:hypothetical protein